MSGPFVCFLFCDGVFVENEVIAAWKVRYMKMSSVVTIFFRSVLLPETVLGTPQFQHWLCNISPSLLRPQNCFQFCRTDTIHDVEDAEKLSSSYFDSCFEWSLDIICCYNSLDTENGLEYRNYPHPRSDVEVWRGKRGRGSGAGRALYRRRGQY